MGVQAAFFRSLQKPNAARKRSNELGSGMSDSTVPYIEKRPPWALVPFTPKVREENLLRSGGNKERAVLLRAVAVLSPSKKPNSEMVRPVDVPEANGP